MPRAIEAGRAVLKLLLDDKELNKKFAATQRKLRNVGRSVRSAGLAIGGVGAAITAPFALATKQFIETGDQLNKMSARTGIAVESLSELKFAAEQSGASLTDVEKAVRTMQRTLLDAEQGTSTATQALSQLGLTLEEIRGQSPERQFELISQRIAAIEDPSKRAAAAMEIFGRSGQVILPMLGDMALLREEARKLGITIDEEAAQSAADLADSFNRLTKTVVALAVQIGAALAPTLIEAANWIQEHVKLAIAWIKRHQGLVTAIAATGAALVAIGATLVTIGGVISASTIAIGALSTALSFLGGVLTFLAAHPIVAALLVIGGVVLWLTDGFGLLNDKVEETGDALNKVAGVKGSANSAGQRGQELAQQQQALQQQIQAQVNSTPTIAAQVPSQPSETDRGILREATIRNRILIDMLTAIRDSAFIAGTA